MLASAYAVEKILKAAGYLRGDDLEVHASMLAVRVDRQPVLGEINASFESRLEAGSSLDEARGRRLESE